MNEMSGIEVRDTLVGRVPPEQCCHRTVIFDHDLRIAAVGNKREMIVVQKIVAISRALAMWIYFR